MRVAQAGCPSRQRGRRGEAWCWPGPRGCPLPPVWLSTPRGQPAGPLAGLLLATADARRSRRLTRRLPADRRCAGRGCNRHSPPGRDGNQDVRCPRRENGTYSAIARRAERRHREGEIAILRLRSLLRGRDDDASRSMSESHGRGRATWIARTKHFHVALGENSLLSRRHLPSVAPESGTFRSSVRLFRDPIVRWCWSVSVESSWPL